MNSSVIFHVENYQKVRIQLLKICEDLLLFFGKLFCFWTVDMTKQLEGEFVMAIYPFIIDILLNN